MIDLSTGSEAAVALAAAVFWGAGDFSGAMGVQSTGGKLTGALRVVMLANASSLLVLLALCWFTHAPWPHGAPLAWSLVAGVTVSISITAFYTALSRGTMGPSAAVSGLLAAAIPAAVSAALEGRPGTLQIAGFVLAAAAIWAIAAGDAHDTPGTMTLAIIGGIGFGVYFVALRLGNPLGLIEPLAIARAASLLTCGLLSLIAARTNIGATTHWNGTAARWALGVATLDTVGTLLFIAATRMGRLDVASVLASLYPASTILLAAWRLHERPTRRQFAGMTLALVAVVMIAL